jgi:hypothetical protein
VYSPLRAKHRAWAVTLSNTVGAVVDSALFLWLAFGSLAFFWGQVIGKELMVAPALIVLALIRWRKRIREEQRDLHVVKRITALMEAERDTVLDDLEQQVDAAIARRKAGA